MVLSRVSDFAPAQAVRHHRLVVELDHGVCATAGNRRLADLPDDDVAAIAQHVVPEDLDAFLGNGEGNALTGVGDTIAAFRQLCGCRNPFGGVVDALGRRGAAMRGIHVHLEGGAVGLQQLLVAFGQLAGVLTHVRRGHRVQRFVARVRVRMMLAGAVVREARLCGRGQTAVPRGNGTVGVARLLAAQWRELGAELRGIGG